MQEHRAILTNATVSKVSDFGFIRVVYENFLKTYFEISLFKVEKFQRSLDHLRVKYIYAILLLTHSLYVLTNIYFLIEHHSEIQLESSDTVAFVRIF